MYEQHIACAHDKRKLLDQVVGELKESGPWQLRCHYYSDDEVIQFVLGRDFGMLCPRSALSLQKLEEDWQERRGPTEHPIFADQVSFGVTPIVFFMNPRVAHNLDVFETPFGWRSLLKLIKIDRALRIRHAAFSKTDGTAVSIAQQMAFRHELDVERDPNTVAQSVRAIERHVEEYGPSDDEVLQRAIGNGTWNADLVIAQERSIIAAAEQMPNLNGTIVYPDDGTLGIPNVAATIAEWRRPGIDEAFHQFSRRLSALTSHELSYNGLHRSTEEVSSPDSIMEFASAQLPALQERLRWAPHAGTTPLVLPARRVVQGIRTVAAATKRGVDVCMLFDISGSMEGSKLTEAKAGVDAFLQILQGEGSRVCLVTFQSRANVVKPLSSNFRSGYPPGSLQTGGQTALLDAVDLGINTLERVGDPDHIWAIVGFTDGMENASSVREADVIRRLISSGNIRFYGIAYGSDADFTSLSAMASASDGLVVRGDPGQIKAVYERLSTYV